MRTEKKMIVIPALIMITLSMTGVAVTHWSDVIYFEGTIKTGGLTLAFDWSELPLCIELHEESSSGLLLPGELYGEDVGHTICSCQDVVMGAVEQGYKTLVVEIQNAYPFYLVHCVFVIHNIGTIPADICEFIVTDPTGVLTWNPDLSTPVEGGTLVDGEGNPIIHILHTSLVGEQVNPGDKVKAEFKFHIAQDAEECHTYSFEIAIVYTQWEQTMENSQVPPPTDINIVVDNDWENDEQVEADVGGNFTWGANAFAKIQDAIDNASPNDNILVYQGTYNENINIDKSLTVRSVEGAENTIINAQGAEFAVLINGENTAATFDGFTVENYDTVGVLAGSFALENDPVEVHILNNIVKQPTIPSCYSNNIQVEDGPKGTVIGNEVSGAIFETGSGIRVASSSNVLVSNNYIHDCGLGILIVGYAEFRGHPAAQNNLIENNSVENNGCGISVRAKSIGTIVRYNDVSNNDVGIESMAFDVGGWPEHSTPLGTKVHHNNIVGNEYGVKSWVYLNNTGTVFAEQVDATLNWWGDSSGPSVFGPGDGDPISANVRYSPWLGSSAGTTPMTFHVDDTGTIQAAIDNALPNETVLVYLGTYKEDVTVDVENLTLIGVGGPGSTVLDASGYDFGFSVQATGVTIDNFAVMNAKLKGIEVHGGNIGGGSVTIRNNSISNNDGHGIYFCSSIVNSEVGIAGNTIDNNGRFGIFFYASIENSVVGVTGNTIDNNGWWGAGWGGVRIWSVVDAMRIEVNNNNIMNNIAYGVNNQGTGILNAENNWWGDPSGPQNSITNPSATGDNVSDHVKYEPWLDAPYLTG